MEPSAHFRFPIQPVRDLDRLWFKHIVRFTQENDRAAIYILNGFFWYKERLSGHALHDLCIDVHANPQFHSLIGNQNANLQRARFRIKFRS